MADMEWRIGGRVWLADAFWKGSGRDKFTSLRYVELINDLTPAVGFGGSAFSLLILVT